MLDKKDTNVFTLVLLCALGAAEQPAAASTFASVLAQTPAPTALPTTPTAVPGLTKLRIASSSSMEKFNEALKQRFEQQFPGKEVIIGYGDSTAALQAVREEKADLAAIGRPLTKREKDRGLVELPVTRNKIAIVVGANNPFSASLTDQQFAKIFRGEIQDWSELGGPPGRIRVIDRPETSDIRQTLSEYPVFQAARFETGTNAVKVSEDSTQAVIRELGTDGIGIAIADQVLNQPGVRVLPMHKTTPDDPKYPFSQRLFYVYKKTNTSAALQNFLGYATAPQGQSAISEARTVLAAATPAATPIAQTAAPGATIPPQPLTPTAPGATIPPQPLTPTAPGATIPPQPLTPTAPGATIPPQPLTPTAPGATIPPQPLTPTAPGATIPPQPLTPTVTASPQTTPLPAAADTSAASSVSNGAVLDLWWVWVSGLLVFLVWGWLKNKRSQPQTNQHLSLSNLDLPKPGASSILEESAAPTLQPPGEDPSPVPAASSRTEETSPTIANSTSGVVTGAEVPPSQPITEQESSPGTSDIAEATPSTAPALTEAETSGVVTGAEVPPSQPITEQESSSGTSDIAEATPSTAPALTEAETSGVVTGAEVPPSQPITEQESSPGTSDIAEATPSTAPALTEAETSGVVTGAEVPPSQPITEQESSSRTSDIAEATPSTATSGLVAWSEIATKGDIAPSKPIAEQESSPTASDMTQATGQDVSDITEPALSAIGHQVEDTTSPSDAPRASDSVAGAESAGEGDISLSQSIPAEESIPTASQLTPETPEAVSETENATGKISFPLDKATIATGAAILSDQPGMASDREASGQEPTENEDSSTAAAKENPTVGDESTIVLLSSQPEWAYAYWNIANEQKEKLHQDSGINLILRLYDVTDIDLNNEQPQSFEENDCSEDSRDAYLLIPARDRDYMVEIGYVTENDRWLMIARSPVVRIPPTSDQDRQLADVEFEAMRLMSVSPVSPELLSSSGGRLGVTNLLNTDASAEKTRPGKLRLLADAELSLYGETEPHANVTINGRQIELNPTGTFRYQMLCPDGESEFTITAVGADGETDSIQIKLTRQTLKPNGTHL